MPPDLALSSTITGSNYPCLELTFMVSKEFEPLKFDCNYLFDLADTPHTKPSVSYLVEALY